MQGGSKCSCISIKTRRFIKRIPFRKRSENGQTHARAIAVIFLRVEKTPKKINYGFSLILDEIKIELWRYDIIEVTI